MKNQTIQTSVEPTDVGNFFKKFYVPMISDICTVYCCMWVYRYVYIYRYEYTCANMVGPLCIYNIIFIRYTHETQREVYVQLIIQGVPFRSYLVRYWHWNGEKWRSPKKNIKFVSDNSVFKHLEFTKKPRSPVFSLKNVDIRCSMGCPWLTTDSPHPSGHPILGAKFRRGRHWGGILSERWWNTQPEGLVIGDKKWIGETRSDDFDHYQLLKMWRCDVFPEMSF